MSDFPNFERLASSHPEAAKKGRECGEMIQGLFATDGKEEFLATLHGFAESFGPVAAFDVLSALEAGLAFKFRDRSSTETAGEDSRGPSGEHS